MLTLMKRIWRAWKGVAHRIIQAQNWVLMSIVYWVALAPVAVVLRLTGHRPVPDAPAPAADGSFWIPREDGAMKMDRATRMF